MWKRNKQINLFDIKLYKHVYTKVRLGSHYVNTNMVHRSDGYPNANRCLFKWMWNLTWKSDIFLRKMTSYHFCTSHKMTTQSRRKILNFCIYLKMHDMSHCQNHKSKFYIHINVISRIFKWLKMNHVKNNTILNLLGVRHPLFILLKWSFWL